MRGKALFAVLVCMICFSIIACGCGSRKEEVGKKEAVPKDYRTPVPKESTEDEQRTVTEIEPLVIKEEKILFDFERGDDGWEIPTWADEQDDYVGTSCEVSSEAAKSGKSSLKLNADFPGGSWRAAIVELEQYFDWTPYKAVSVDIYIPKDVPEGLRAKLILTVGETWKWTEMSTTKQLAPGEWTTITADLRPNSYDWKRTVPTDAFRQDIRKIAVRIESNKKPVYKGPIYIDNVKVGK